MQITLDFNIIAHLHRKNNYFLQNIMGGLGSLDHFLQKNIYYLTKYAIKMQYIGGSMKISDNLCKSLCIYDSRSPAHTKGGWGVYL